jgi:hypothetical protein
MSQSRLSLYETSIVAIAAIGGFMTSFMNIEPEELDVSVPTALITAGIVGTMQATVNVSLSLALPGSMKWMVPIIVVSGLHYKARQVAPKWKSKPPE